MSSGMMIVLLLILKSLERRLVSRLILMKVM